MLLIQYETVNHQFQLMRNNPRTGVAEVREFEGSLVPFLMPDDGAMSSLLALAKEVPNSWHVVPNPKPAPRKVWGRMVL